MKAFDDDGQSVSRQLDPWFQQEIDRQAMALGLVGSDAYLEHWHWEDVEGDLDEVALELERRRPTDR